MSGNSNSSVAGSSGTKQDDGSGNDKQKPTSPNPSGSQQNELVHGGGGEPGKNTDVPPVHGDSSNDRGSSTSKDLFERTSDPSPSAADNTVTPSTTTQNDIFGRNGDKSVPEKKLSSNAKDPAPQTSHNAHALFAPGESSCAQGSSDSVSETLPSGVSSTTGEHSSETDTGTGPSAYGLLGR